MRICVTHNHTKTTLSDNYHRVRLEELDAVENSSCLEIHLLDTADYVQYDERRALYELALSKLRHGGKLIVTGNDLYSIGRDISQNTLSLEDANNALFNMRLSMESLGMLKSTFNELGLKIETAYYDFGNTYVIEAIRR